MVQTNPAAALLGTGANGKASSNSAKTGDDGAFKREFEQVSRSAEPHNDAPSSATDDKVKETAESQQSPKTQEATEREPREQAASDEMTEEEVVAEGGKKLPPVAALELEDEGETDTDALAAEQLENPQAVLQTLMQQEGKQANRAATDESKLAAVQPTAVKGEVKAESGADDTLSFSNLRLRDLNPADLANLGRDGGSATAQQGKGDNALFTLVNGASRSATSFGEVLNTSAAAASVNTTQPQQPAATLPAQMSIAIPLQQSGWDQAMGERVVWMARNNLQQAQIQLNPRELGPIEIKISVQNDQTQVNFVAHHATTRDAIEAALPKLREMLSEQGLNLGQADVSQHSFGDNQRQAAVADQRNGLGGTSGGEPEQDVAGDEITTHVSRVSSNAVDYFA